MPALKDDDDTMVNQAPYACQRGHSFPPTKKEHLSNGGKWQVISPDVMLYYTSPQQLHSIAVNFGVAFLLNPLNTYISCR